MTCHNCSDYEPNIEKLDSIVALSSLRAGNKNLYDGKPFEFCPWCGGVLSHNTELDEVVREIPDKQSQ